MRKLGPFVAGFFLFVACKESPLAKIEAVRDSLATDDPAALVKATELPRCVDMTAYALAPRDASPRDQGCFSDIANALGSKKGFSTTPLDQASAATAAAVVARDGRGDLFGQSDIWLGALKSSQGAGFDALRLAIAKRMAETAPLVGRPLFEESDARGAMKAIAAAIPGACPTYFLLGGGEEVPNVPPALQPDHAACVQHDLARREGPGAAYGSGPFRALEGSLALWRETERALRQGRDHVGPSAKRAFEAKLSAIEGATRKIETKKLESTIVAQTLSTLGDMHAEAGVVLFRTRDAGADASP